MPALPPIGGMISEAVGVAQSGEWRLIQAVRWTGRALSPVLGPGVVPRRSDYNSLGRQTALSTITGAKGLFRDCKTGRMADPATSATGKRWHSDVTFSRE
jgi:hypothetical protein